MRQEPTSPIFEKGFEENLYNSPTSFKNKNANNSSRENSPAKSEENRRRASSRSELSYDNEDQKGGYCVMSSVPPKRRSKPSLTEVPTDQIKRESGMYMSMQSPTATQVKP